MFMSIMFIFTMQGMWKLLGQLHRPTPTNAPGDVISIFSNAYSNVPGTNFYPDWGQTTSVSEVPIFGNNTLLYAGFNYQGIELGSNLDVSGMSHLHIDYWTANSTGLNVYLISPGPVEAPYVLGVPTSGWASVNIPLSNFSPVDLADLIQLKFDGSGDIYLDNIYFYNETSGETCQLLRRRHPLTLHQVLSLFLAMLIQV